MAKLEKTYHPVIFSKKYTQLRFKEILYVIS